MITCFVVNIEQWYRNRYNGDGESKLELTVVRNYSNSILLNALSTDCQACDYTIAKWGQFQNWV